MRVGSRRAVSIHTYNCMLFPVVVGGEVRELQRGHAHQKRPTWPQGKPSRIHLLKIKMTGLTIMDPDIFTF